MNKLFANTRNILSEVQTMQNDEAPHQEDRIVVSDFFHGQPPYSDAEAAALGITVNSNNLFGYDHLASARDQLLSLYTTPPRIWEIELDCAPGWAKKGWEAKSTMHWNRIMKQSGRMKSHYEFVAGDSTMHGEGFWWNPSVADWCPKHCSLARRLVPSGATLDLDELTHFAVTAEMTFNEVVTRAKKGGKGWNQANLRALQQQIFGKAGEQGSEIGPDVRSAVDSQNVELLGYHRQANAGLDKVWKWTVPVIYFYQRDFDSPTHSFDCTILTRDAISAMNSGRDDAVAEAVLFEREGFIPNIHRALFPMHMNSAIGGEALWHRVKGLGHLNYSLSWHLETLMSRALQAVHEQGTTFFQAADSASREAMEQIMLKHNGIIPEGIQMVQNRVGGDFQGFLSLMQLMRQQGATNANSISPNNGAEGTNALQVQAIFQQNMVGANATNRVSHWFDYMNRLGREVLRRFTDPLRCKEETGPGISEIMEFQAAMMREGIPLSALQPANVRVTTARVVGDGVKQKAASAAQGMMQSISMYGPDAQQDIRRMYAAVLTDDYELAERWVPYSEQPDESQVLNAETENNVFDRQQKPMPIRDRDQDEVHIQVHMDYMGSLVEKGMKEQQMAFTQDQLGAFKAAGAHTYMHIRDRVEPVNKDSAAKYMDELNKLSSMAQKLANNLQQQQQQAQQQPQIDPIKQADVLLKKRALDQNQEKIDFAKEKNAAAHDLRERQQALREHEAAARQHLSLTGDIRDDHKTRQEMAIADAEAAAGINATTQQPQPAVV